MGLVVAEGGHGDQGIEMAHRIYPLVDMSHALPTHETVHQEEIIQEEGVGQLAIELVAITVERLDEPLEFGKGAQRIRIARRELGEDGLMVGRLERSLRDDFHEGDIGFHLTADDAHRLLDGAQGLGTAADHQQQLRQSPIGRYG